MQFIQSAILILIGAVLGSLLTYWGRIGFAKRTEYYRQRPIVKKTIENTISKVSQYNHPYLLLEDPVLNGPINDILKVMPFCKRMGFKRKWNECRHDKETYDLTPREYQTSTLIGRRLITERLHNLISKL